MELLTRLESCIQHHVWGSTSNDRVRSGIFDLPQYRSLPARVCKMFFIVIFSFYFYYLSYFLSVSSEYCAWCCLPTNNKFVIIKIIYFSSRCYFLFTWFFTFRSKSQVLSMLYKSTCTCAMKSADLIIFVVEGYHFSCWSEYIVKYLVVHFFVQSLFMLQRLCIISVTAIFHA